jgi:GT2 family glycosyltransferase
MKNVTVGICVYKLSLDLVDLFDNLIKQTYDLKKIKIIVVYNKIDDVEVLVFLNNLFKKTFQNILFVNDEGKGLAYARQLVLKNAESIYLIYVDSDVLLEKNFIKNQVEYLNKYNDVALVIGINEYEEDENNLISEVQNLFFTILSNIPHFGATACRVKALKDIDGFDLRIKGAAEDIDIKTRLVLKGWKFSTNINAKFRHLPKTSLRSISKQNLWYGYGDHLLYHKYSNLISLSQRSLPYFFGWGIKLSFQSYKKYRNSRAFLIPLLSIFVSMNWWIGFIKSHFEGYGHLYRENEPIGLLS